ncbi:hypothetical protein AMK59_3042 [Oryctes borbonicus]|uniref:Protein-cysteine N-palmitoyltransferase Rasp n=1 Tax=Oryctes borbonicus TaxID=1629725 RepID=A0A0T6B5X4_9SCAR|nr:hypothetical protein AMK59_3042 [Oryctes borbonicus]
MTVNIINITKKSRSNIFSQNYIFSYIYVPLKKVKFPSYLASFFSFCFVYIWHGWSKDIMVWALLNYVCVTIESAFKHYYNKYIRKWCEQTFNCNWRQRFACMLAAPLLALSAISNFYFFAGMDVGNIFFRKFLEGNTQRLCTVLFSLYCCSQISSYIKKREELSYLANKLK